MGEWIRVVRPYNQEKYIGGTLYIEKNRNKILTIKKSARLSDKTNLWKECI